MLLFHAMFRDWQMHPAIHQMATELQEIKEKLLATETRLAAAEDDLGACAAENTRLLLWKAQILAATDAFAATESSGVAQTREGSPDASDEASRRDDEADEASVCASMCCLLESGVHE